MRTLPPSARLMVRAYGLLPAFLRGGRTPEEMHRARCTRRMVRHLDAGLPSKAMVAVWAGADPNAHDSAGQTLLLRHLKDDVSRWSIEDLLALGADPNVRGADGLLPLEAVLGCWYGRSLAEVLIEGGADVDALTRNGDPILLAAIDAKRFGVASELIKAGAHLGLRAAGGRSALDRLVAPWLKDAPDHDPSDGLLAMALGMKVHLDRLSDRDVRHLAWCLDPLEHSSSDDRKNWPAAAMEALVRLRPAQFPYRCPDLEGIRLSPAEMRGYLPRHCDPAMMRGLPYADRAVADYVERKISQDQQDLARVERAFEHWSSGDRLPTAAVILNWRATIGHETEMFREAPWAEHRVRPYGAVVPVSDLEPGVARLVKVLNGLCAETSLSCAGHDPAPTAYVWFECGYSAAWARTMGDMAGASRLGFTWGGQMRKELRVAAANHTDLLGRTLVLAERLLADGADLLRARATVIAQLSEADVTPSQFEDALRAHPWIARRIAEEANEGQDTATAERTAPAREGIA